MKTFIRRYLVILPLLATFGFAKPEINNQDIIKQHTYNKMSEISNELYAKRGVSVVVNLIESIGGNIIEYENNISKNIQSPHVILVLSSKDQKVDLLVSSELKDTVNKNEILNAFIIPILVAQDENTLEARYSAAILNGVAEVADEIATSKNIVLTSSIGFESRNFMQTLRVLFYGILVA